MINKRKNVSVSNYQTVTVRKLQQDKVQQLRFRPHSLYRFRQRTSLILPSTKELFRTKLRLIIYDETHV